MPGHPRFSPAVMRRTARGASVVAPRPMPEPVDVLERFFPDAPAVRALRTISRICPPVVHVRRR